MPFWIVETPRSIIDPTRHKHVIFGLNQPGGGIYVDGPFPTEGRAVDALNELQKYGAPPCAYCGKELELTCSYDRLYDDMIISGALYCPDCWELDVWAEPPLEGAELERWTAAMAENRRRSDTTGASTEGEPPAPVLNPREF